MHKTRFRSFLLCLGFILLIANTSCGGGPAPLATPKADSATTKPPVAPSVNPASLPPICNCILRVDLLSVEHGLSQSSVRVIFQDSRGFLWFGTEDGLNRYDGYAFTIYKHEPSNPTSISNGWITAITEDHNGYLWIGTRAGGLNRFDPFRETFTQYLHNKNNPSSIADNHVSSLFVDANNQLWVGTLNGLVRFDNPTNTFRQYPYNTPIPVTETTPGETIDTPTETIPLQTTLIRSQKSSSKNISTIYQDALGRYWVGTLDGGLNGFEPETGTFTHYQNISGIPSTISSNRVTAIIDAGENDLWVGTQNGLNLFNPETGKFKNYLHDDKDPNSLSNNSINVLQRDHSGNLWVGTSDGLDRLRQDRTTFVHYRNDPSFSRSLSNNYIMSIYEDRGGIMWFGTYGGGVNKYDRQRDKFALYRHNIEDLNSLSGNLIFPIMVDSKGFAWIGTADDGLNRFHWRTGENTRYYHNPDNLASISSNKILAIHEDSENIIWLGSNNGLDRFDPINRTFIHYRNDPSNPNSLSSNRVYAIYEDTHQHLWVGTFAGLDRLDKTTGVFTHYYADAANPTSLSGFNPLAILEDQQGYIWVGTSESGLNRLDPKTNEFTRYRRDLENKNSLSNDSILSLYEDSKGRLWVGTAGGGLNLYHPESNTFSYYLERDGLPNGSIYGILEDDQGNLWMSTNFGISRFDPETEIFRNFDDGDGLQSNEFNSSAFAKGLDGEFYFGGINGLTVFHPNDINASKYTPPVVLTSLSQGDEPVSMDVSVETVQNITFVWPQNSFEFEFSALGFSQPEKQQYAYFLQGFDDDWHLIGEKRNGRYTNLPGGDYTLMLKSANSDGVWSINPTRIHITVVPPYWQTLPFQAMVGLLIVALVAGGVRLRTKTIRERNWQLEKLVRERTYALEKRNREMEALYQADEKILRNVSMNQVFQTLVNVAVDMLHADRSVVFAWDERQTKIVPRVSHGFSPSSLKALEFSEGEGIVGQVLTTGAAVAVANINPNDLRADVRDVIVAEGIRSFVHLPIVVDHKVVAVFNVGFTRSNPLGDEAVRVFSALAHRASLSITNMELFEQTKDLAVMEERNRLARDLHDSAKQKAFAALAQLGTARGILNGNGRPVSMHLDEAENLISDVIQELTFLVQEIYPLALQEKGLPAALREYIYEWENRNDPTVKLIVRNERRLPLEIEQALYRVAQESLANVARHSKAKRVDVSLVYNADSAQLSISDDGCGFDMQTRSYGMGLRSIRERVSSIHGTVQIQSAPGHGTRLLMQVPTKG